jgi:hypothetical protein
MPFRIKNGPPTFQRAMTKTFKEYLLDSFMNFFWIILKFIMMWRFICRSLDYAFKSVGNIISV